MKSPSRHFITDIPPSTEYVERMKNRASMSKGQPHHRNKYVARKLTCRHARSLAITPTCTRRSPATISQNSPSLIGCFERSLSCKLRRETILAKTSPGKRGRRVNFEQRATSCEQLLRGSQGMKISLCPLYKADWSFQAFLPRHSIVTRYPNESFRVRVRGVECSAEYSFLYGTPR